MSTHTVILDTPTEHSLEEITAWTVIVLHYDGTLITWNGSISYNVYRAVGSHWRHTDLFTDTTATCQYEAWKVAAGWMETS